MKFKTFFKQHLVWLGLLVVLLPLLIILYVQYHSLAKLGETLPAARKVAFDRRLKTVASEVSAYYRETALRSLAVPAEVFDPKMAKDWPALDAAVKRHYEQQPAEGVRYYFATVVSENGKERVLSMYDTRDGAMLEGMITDKGWAAFAASAPWITLMRKGKHFPLAPDALFLADNDPDHPVIVKPITDDSSQIIGVAGLLIDKAYFKETYLPRIIRAAAQKFFPGEEQANLILAAYDEAGGVVAATEPLTQEGAEVKVPLQFPFPRWHLGVQSRGPTQDQLGRRQLVLGLSLTALMTLIIVGGLVFALRAAAREMKLSQMKTDFVSNVSHELRTPLSSIRVFGEFQRLGRVKDPSKVREYGEYIETESRRLTQLINNILDFSRIESGQKTYRFVRADVREIVDETLRTFAVRLQQSGFAVTVEAPEQELPPAVVDPEAVGQVIVNLLDNAVKYSGAAREIIVRVGEQDGHVTVEVSDQGVGIPAEEQAKIFERFHRVSTGLVHDVKGSGLGLSLVKHIIEAHGGKVTLQSELGRGSAFTVHLPVWREASAAADACQPQPSLQPGEIGHG